MDAGHPDWLTMWCSSFDCSGKNNQRRKLSHKRAAITGPQLISANQSLGGLFILCFTNTLIVKQLVFTAGFGNDGASLLQPMDLPEQT